MFSPLAAPIVPSGALLLKAKQRPGGSAFTLEILTSGLVSPKGFSLQISSDWNPGKTLISQHQEAMGSFKTKKAVSLFAVGTFPSPVARGSAALPRLFSKSESLRKQATE